MSCYLNEHQRQCYVVAVAAADGDENGEDDEGESVMSWMNQHQQVKLPRHRCHQ